MVVCGKNIQVMIHLRTMAFSSSQQETSKFQSIQTRTCLTDGMGREFCVVADGYEYKDNAAIIDSNTINDYETLVGYESVK